MITIKPWRRPRVVDPVPPKLRQREAELAALCELQIQRIRGLRHQVASMERACRDTEERLASVRQTIAAIVSVHARREEADRESR